MIDTLVRAGAIGLFLLASVMAATDEEAESKTADAAKPTDPRPKQPAPSRSSAPAPASTFTPSEQIKADSSVSFPVDI